MSKLFNKQKQHRGGASANMSVEFVEIPAISMGNIDKLIQWLASIVDALQSREDIVKTVCILPSKLQDSLGKTVQELLLLRKETAAALAEIERLQFQTKALSCQNKQISSNLKQLKEQETSLKECIAADGWQTMHCKWLQLKKSRNNKQLEQFLEEISEKQSRLLILKNLTEERIEQLALQSKQKSAKKKKKRVITPIQEEGEDGDDEYESNSSAKHSRSSDIPDGVLSILFESPRSRSRSH